ncbi:MAG: SDR family oxidoreductase [Actinobacteria bacterium]|nr:SDR family oxidoreductase [Actinomycetota bacterium]
MAGVKGRVVVITGAGGGLGRQHAKLFAQQGARVVVNDLGGNRDGSGFGSDMADAVVSEITDAGGEAVANYDDVSTVDGGQRAVAAALDAFGQVDIVVNNAGILRDKSFHKMTPEQWDAVLKVHLYGAFNVTRAAWPHLRAQQFGRVVVTTSTSGLFGNFGQANYGAAKMGMVGLINTLAVEGARFNITANAVAPLADTRMTADVIPDDARMDLDPAYASPIVVHLCSEECTDTGVITLASGGHYARIAYMQAVGVQFDHVPSVEEIGVAWDEIMDLTDSAMGRNPLA